MAAHEEPASEADASLQLVRDVPVVHSGALEPLTAAALLAELLVQDLPDEAIDGHRVVPHVG
jgi:hypothetical protein